MISIIKTLIPDEYNKNEKDKKKKRILESEFLSKKAEESKSRFEKSLIELEELLKKQKND